MLKPNQIFTQNTKKAALLRQFNKCASCGTYIPYLGEAGRELHRYGERADAHHVSHAKFEGANTLDNCVILCWACHYSAHEGGNYRYGTVVGCESDYPHFRG
ncbi:MAG: HNH endonuclease [Desulfamplus sp.]|nr:HNH endonuclease [Desulfamplus sp.]